MWWLKRFSFNNILWCKNRNKCLNVKFEGIGLSHIKHVFCISVLWNKKRHKLKKTCNPLLINILFMFCLQRSAEVFLLLPFHTWRQTHNFSFHIQPVTSQVIYFPDFLYHISFWAEHHFLILPNKKHMLQSHIREYKIAYLLWWHIYLIVSSRWSGFKLQRMEQEAISIPVEASICLVSPGNV